MKLSGRVALITGGGTGMGRAIAETFAREGARVIVNYSRSRKEAEEVVAAICSEGGSAIAISADVAQDSEVRAMLDQIGGAFGRLDVLVNNAGVGVGAPVAEILTKRLDMQLDVNLRSIIIFYRECLEMLKAAAAEHRSALVVNTSSMAGKRGEGWLSVYSAAKHGVVGWTEAMNKELGGEGIKSTALCPAFVDTPMTDFIKEHVKPEDMIRPEDIAESVRFLLRLSPACVVPEIMFVRPGEGV